MHMRDHYRFLQVFYLVIAFFEQIIDVFLAYLVQAYVSASCSEDSHILILHRIAMDVLHAVKLCKKISCSKAFMVSRYKKHLLVLLHKRPHNALCALVKECQVAAEYYKVHILLLCLVSKLPCKTHISMYVS